MVRRQLPVHSPVPARALLEGLRAAVGSSAGHRERVESRIREHFGADGVLLTDSGTSALALSIAAAGARGAGDADLVALPAYGCYDLATAAQAAGAGAVLYDVSPRFLGPDWDSFTEAVHTDGVGCAVLAPLYGVPVDMDRARDAVSELPVTLVEDAAQGVGARYRGRPVGAWGALSVLSFGRGKGLTGGGGGALLTHGDAGRKTSGRLAYDLVRARTGWPELGAAAGQWALGRPSLYGIPSSLPFLGLGETVYHPPGPPLASMPDACLGVLAGSWEASFGEVELRRRNASRLARGVRAGDDVHGIEPPEGAEPGYLRLPVLPRGRAASRRLTGRDARMLGIERGYPRPLSRLAPFRDDVVNADADFPGAERLARDLVTLPTHGFLRERDLRRLEDRCRGPRGPAPGAVVP